MSDLIKQLNDIGEWFDEKNMLLSGGLIDDTIDHIKQLEQKLSDAEKQNEWIGVEDDLPDKGVSVLIAQYCFDDKTKGRFFEVAAMRGKFWISNIGTDYEDVCFMPTHWKPITPPEVDKDE